MMRSILLISIVFSFLANAAFAQKKAKSKVQDGASLDRAVVDIYKTIGEINLKIYRFNPQDHKDSDQRPAVVFFFGGGWKNGDPKQFANQCAHLASRGMIAMTAEYRVASKHQAKAIDCVEDAKSAIRWVRMNAARLGIDPNRIAAGGGSAGGHLAACTGVVSGFERSTEDVSISSVPNAMILFNPALVLNDVEGEEPIKKEKLEELRERIGAEPTKVSPYHHVAKGAPPTIILHGRADTTVPFRTAEIFAEIMKNNGNRCELVGYPEMGHGFFNYGRDKENKGYQESLDATVSFLTSLGYLVAESADKASKN
jgi:acetyl esterase